uniref:Uncharacterized protein n=1 Tax=Ditylenchus dipsaci TaxID=166011 RepID=A0A915DMY2_9BILA
MPTSAAIPATSLIHHLPSSGGGSQQQPGVAVSASSLSTASKQHLFSSHHDNNSSMGHHSINSSAASIISTTHTVGSNSSGCGRSGCSGAILVMFPSSPSRPSTVGTIRANVRTGGPSFASSPTATSSSILVNGDNAGAQKFCACGGDEETAGLDRTTPAHSPNVSSSVVMDGSSYVNSSLKSGSYLGSSGLGTNGTHSNAEDCMDVETEDEPEAQLYIDTQLANLDFHTPSSHCQSQKRLSSNEGAVSHSPMSSSQFLSIRNRSNTNPHSQSIFSSSNSPVPNYFSSSFDGAKSPLSLKAMVNNNTSNSQSNHQASTYHPLSPARVPRPLGTFRRYHAHSISGNSGDERANHPNNHHRSHQNFSRTAAMNSMHNARSIDSAGNFGHAHPSNTTSVDLSRTALLIREKKETLQSSSSFSLQQQQIEKKN